jgi:hypothetical protein
VHGCTNNDRSLELPNQNKRLDIPIITNMEVYKIEINKKHYDNKKYIKNEDKIDKMS